MIEKEYINWPMVEEFCDSVIKEYQDEHITGVYGLPRGGLVMAVIISHRMHIPMLMAPVEGCIIVDDVCDTGESLIHYVNNSSGIHKPKYHIATLCYKRNKLGIVPEMCGYNIENKWIVFPWEDRTEV